MYSLSFIFSPIRHTVSFFGIGISYIRVSLQNKLLPITLKIPVSMICLIGQFTYFLPYFHLGIIVAILESQDSEVQLIITTIQASTNTKSARLDFLFQFVCCIKMFAILHIYMQVLNNPLSYYNQAHALTTTYFHWFCILINHAKEELICIIIFLNQEILI